MAVRCVLQLGQLLLVALLSLHNSPSRIVERERALWRDRRGELIAGREGRKGGPHPANIDSLLTTI
jgi:hypothetical protein